jgi:hypothetical protein
MGKLKKVIRIRENLENQKKTHIFAVLKETKSINRSIWNIKNRKIMGYINNIYFEFEIWYLQSPIEKQVYRFVSTIEKMNESIDRMKNNNLNYLKMDKRKIIYEIIKIVCTAIISIAAVLTAQSCTMSLSVSKNNSNSTQKTEQTTTSSVGFYYAYNFECVCIR